MCAAAASGCGRDTASSNPSAAPAVTSSLPAPEEDARIVYDADQALVRLLAAGDAASLQPSLDDEFTWITAAGVHRARPSILMSLPRPAITAIDPDTEARRLGAHVAVVKHHSGPAHAMHVWVRRPAGWRLLHISEVVEGDRVVYGGTRMGGAPCVNPCQSVPFAPANDVEQAIIAAWQAQQSGPDEWARHVPEDNVARTSNGTYTKADRVAVQQQQAAAGTVVAPSPLTWARIWEFGDAALMIALQPRAVGKPFWGSRVFELRGGTWAMAESYQTTIAQHPPY
jgi:hypothetical protein